MRRIRMSERFDIFCQAGANRAHRWPSDLVAFLENVIHEVKRPRSEPRLSSEGLGAPILGPIGGALLPARRAVAESYRRTQLGYDHMGRRTAARTAAHCEQRTPRKVYCRAVRLGRRLVAAGAL